MLRRRSVIKSSTLRCTVPNHHRFVLSSLTLVLMASLVCVGCSQAQFSPQAASTAPEQTVARLAVPVVEVPTAASPAHELATAPEIANKAEAASAQPVAQSANSSSDSARTPSKDS